MKKNEFEQIRITIFADNTENAIEMLEKKLAELKVQKEKEKWVFTEYEKAILINLPKKYKWIARDWVGSGLWVYGEKPKKMGLVWANSDVNAELNTFYNLFQCIQWTDTEPCEFRKYI